MELIYGVGQANRVVPDVEGLLHKYLDDVGLRYLGYRPSTPRDALVPEDLAVTVRVPRHHEVDGIESPRSFDRLRLSQDDRPGRRFPGGRVPVSSWVGWRAFASARELGAHSVPA